MCLGAEPVSRRSVAPTPAPIVAGNPDSDRSRNNRLIAAQQDTGFKLGDLVRTNETGEYGQVVGFGRIDASADRVLLVEFSGDDDGREIVAIDPSDVDFAGRLQA